MNQPSQTYKKRFSQTIVGNSSLQKTDLMIKGWDNFILYQKPNRCAHKRCGRHFGLSKV